MDLQYCYAFDKGAFFNIRFPNFGNKGEKNMRYQFLRFPGGKPKAVTLSYDDGCAQDLHFVQIINDHGMKATFNICTGLIAKEPGGDYLTGEEIRTNLRDAGHEIAMHGAHHKMPGAVRPIEGIRDVLECRLGLEDLLSDIVQGMAYPDYGIMRLDNGYSREQIKAYLKDLDIAYARVWGEDNCDFLLPEDWLHWVPTAHHNQKQIFAWIEAFTALDMRKIGGNCRHPRLFYLWGHSYEFERDQNWDHLDSICKKLGHKEDTWYATNMEIYNYVQAYRKLVYSADGQRIFNPTLEKLWFEKDGKMYTLDSGCQIIIE